MRIEQSATDFQPVTITLQSQTELNTFRTLLNVAYNESGSGSDVERLADEMREDIDRFSVWSSSSMSC